MIKRNIIANWLGQGFSALMGLAFVPLYIRYLGMEAYGLIGIFVLLQAWLSILDMGITPTLNREMARFTAGAHTPQSIHNLLRSLELVCFILAALIAGGLWASSNWLATEWINVGQLSTVVVAKSLSLMAIIVSLRFIEGIYRGSLFGLQLQLWYNGVYAISNALRHCGVIGVLAWISPTISAFFIWQGTISLLTLVIYATKVHRKLPRPLSRPRFSRKAISEIWLFAGGMAGTTFLGLLLTQVDKVLLSRLLTLDKFGYYALATAVASILPMVVSPVAQAVYPRMVEILTRGNQAELVSIYHKSAQLITVLTAPIMLLLAFFAGGVVFMWSGDVLLAENTAPVLSILILGTFLNGLMIIPYMLQIAHGWTSLAIKTNIVAVSLLVPAIFWVAPIYGAVGAAWIWGILNTGYVLIAIQFMHRRIIPDEKWHWYFSDLLQPIGGAVVIMIIAWHFQPTAYQDRLSWFFFLLITGSIALTMSTIMANDIRIRILSYWRSF